MARTKEGFEGVSDYNQFGNPGAGRQAYIASSDQKYNPFGSTIDIRTPNFAKAKSPAEIQTVNTNIERAVSTAGLAPSDASGDKTLLGVQRQTTEIKLPPQNEVLTDATKYEKIVGREPSCMKLETPGFENMGVCLKDGTPYSYENPGKHIGGMLVLPEDRKYAEDIGRESGKEPTYAPSLGSCEPGAFAVKRDKCIELMNRLDCKEAGETGGFRGGGRTAEGKMGVVDEKCAQVPVAGEDVFIYYPKEGGVGKPATGSFDVSLRILTPSGTGMCKVLVYNTSKQLVAQATSNTPGKEFTVTIPRTRELTKYQVIVSLQTPHRPVGKPEVFQIIENPAGLDGPGYNQSYESAKALCERIGTRIATRSELESSWRAGAQACSAGWVRQDGRDTGVGLYPTKAFHKQGGCGPNTNNGNNLVEWNYAGKAHSWCYGVKPPRSNNTLFYNLIVDFFNSYGDAALPSQKDMPNIWSQNGPEYQAPSYRGVLIQWEMSDGSQMRTVPFEPTILGINGQGPSTVGVDGSRSFKVLRRNGTYAGSSQIVSPRPHSGSRMLRNQFWLWSNLANDQAVTFDVQVPGTFTAPFYAADNALAARGPLLTNKETAGLLKTSPCLKDGQSAGKYSMECLTNLFQSAGGDLVNGKLATTGEGLARLNTMGDMDAIGKYLSDLYLLATTGRDSSGSRLASADRKKRMNEAAQLLFGFDLTTPCEDVTEDKAGNILIVPKSGALDADCLDHLWLNAGMDVNRGGENPMRKTQLKATYTSIQDRFSGLRNNEGTAARREQSPFQACQRAGSMAPIRPDGTVNPSAVNTARAAGGIEQIQSLYDKIHREANYTPVAGELSSMAADAVAKCYGVQKSVDNVTRQGCGVAARYVRLLATGIYAASRHHTDSCIQIPQLQVFDAEGNELAKGRPVSVGSIGYGGLPQYAVDGKAYPHGHGEGEYHDSCHPGSTPDNQFWMVDLGRMVEVSEVRYHPRTDCCNFRQIAAPIQLLDASRRIVAQKSLGAANWPGRWGQSETLKFTSADITPAIAIKDLVPGVRLSAMSATSFDRFMIASGGSIRSLGHGGSGAYTNEFRRDATFNLVPALNGRAGYVSFQYTPNTNYYMRHAGFRMWLHWQGGDQLYKNDASFRIVPALNGDPNMVSFESSNYPGYYVSTHREAPDQVWITRVNSSDAWDSQRASWKVTLPLA